MEPKYVRTSVAAKHFGVSDQTIRRWADNGLISSIRSNGTKTGNRLYDINSVTQEHQDKCNQKKARKKLKEYVTVESPQEDKKMISIDKLNICKTNFQITKPSLILEVDSTLNEKDFSNLSKEFLKENLMKLWLPTKTDYVGLDSTLSNSYVRNITVNSLFSMKEMTMKNLSSQKISCQLLQSSVPKLTAEENIKEVKILNECIYIMPSGKHKDLPCGKKVKKYNLCTSHLKNSHDENVAIRTFKVQIFPTKSQIKTFEKWFNGARATYNLCVEQLKNNVTEELQIFDRWRDEYVTEVSARKYGKVKHYLGEKICPKEVRAGACQEFITSINNEIVKINKCKYNLENSEGEKKAYYERKLVRLRKFFIKFRKKKLDQSVSIAKASLSICEGNIKLYKRFCKEPLKVRRAKDDRKYLKLLEEGYTNRNARLIKSARKYYLCISYDAKAVANTDDSTISIDPGVRSFITCYNPNGEVMEVSDNSNISKLRSRISKMQRLKKPYKHLYVRLKRLVNDMHYKVVDHLTKRYKNIIIPKFGTSRMLRGRKLNRKTKFCMQALSHYSFRKKLIDKAQLRSCNVLVCDERYTSKTCGRCFEQYDIKGSKTYKCPSCNIKIDRDVNGARNILIRCIQ